MMTTAISLSTDYVPGMFLSSLRESSKGILTVILTMAYEAIHDLA